MLKRTFPGALAAAVIGVAASGSSLPDFAQNVPVRCLPQEIQAGVLHDGCSGAVTFGMNGPMVVTSRAPDVEATGSIIRRMRDHTTKSSGDRSD